MRSMKKYRKPKAYRSEESRIISIRAKNNLLESLQKITAKEGLKLNTLINGVLEDYIAWYFKNN